MKIAIVAVFSILFSSCFSIREIVHFNKDGSGTFEVRTDLSQLLGMVEMMNGLDDSEEEAADEAEDVIEPEEEDPLAEYAEVYRAQVQQIRNIAGITDARVVDDEIAAVVGIYFNFKNASALNAALNVLYADEAKSSNRVFFKVSKKKVERIDVVNMKNEVLKAMGEDDEVDEETLDMMKAMFKDVTYTTEYSFEKRVKKSNNPAAVINANKVVLTQNLFDDESKVKLDEIIKLK